MVELAYIRNKQNIYLSISVCNGVEMVRAGSANSIPFLMAFCLLMRRRLLFPPINYASEYFPSAGPINRHRVRSNRLNIDTLPIYHMWECLFIYYLFRSKLQQTNQSLVRIMFDHLNKVVWNIYIYIVVGANSAQARQFFSLRHDKECGLVTLHDLFGCIYAVCLVPCVC